MPEQGALLQAAQSESVKQGFGGNMYALINKSQPNWRKNLTAMQGLGFNVVDEGESIILFYSP